LWDGQLVGGDHDKVFDPALVRRHSQVISPEDVVFDSLEDMLFHQRHMLISRRMIDHKRPVLAQDVV